MLNRQKYTEDQHRTRRSKQREVIDADPASKPKAKEAPATAVAKSARFYIVEATDPKSGGTIFVVTDGGNARAECTTRELAAQILKALEKS